MPKLSIKDKKGVVIFDEQDWLAGLNTMSTSGELSKLPGNRSQSNVSVLTQYGYVTASPLRTSVSNASQITTILRNSVNSGEAAYIISAGSLVHKLTSLLSGTISTTAPFPHTVNNSSAWTGFAGDDIALYYANVSSTSKQLVFFSGSYTETGTPKWNVGIYDIAADTFNDDFMSTVPASPLAAPYITGGATYPHPLIVGDDDILYIGDRNFVHAFDGSTGADGTFYPAVLTLPKGEIITSFTRTQDINLAIGTYLNSSNTSSPSVLFRGNAKVWIWNYLALDPDYSRDLRDNYVSELIQWGGTIAAFTSGRKTLNDAGVNKLQALNGLEFEVVKTWNTGGLPIRGGVDNVSNDLYWNSGGILYTYTKRPDNGQYILNTYGTGGGSSGLLKFFSASSTIHYSTGTGADSGGLEYTSTNFQEGGSIRTQVVAPEFNIRERGRLMSITVGFGGTFASTGRGFELVTYIDGTTSLSTGEVSSISGTRIVKFTTDSLGNPLGDFNYLQAQPGFTTGGGSATAPIVSWIRYDFDIVNVNAS